MQERITTSSYRYPYEHIILGATILVVLLVIALTATATVCTSAIFVPVVVMMGYYASRNKHQELLRQAQPVTSQSSPELYRLLRVNSARLQVEQLNVFVIPSPALNAYTFGMDSPKAIVLFSSLFQVMDRDEIQFILGHEMGHVTLGHTWLNTLVGGMAGIPSSLGAAAIMELAFRWWNRACEYSADRAGVLACGKPNKAISALIKLEAGSAALTQMGMQAAFKHIEEDDEDIMHKMEELIASHPMIARRINELRQYTRTQEYQRLLSQMDTFPES